LYEKSLNDYDKKQTKKSKQKLTPFERKKINVLQLLAKPKMFKKIKTKIDPF